MILPSNQVAKIQSRRKRKNRRLAEGVPVDKSDEVRYRRQLLGIVEVLTATTKKELFGLLKTAEQEYPPEKGVQDSETVLYTDSAIDDINRTINKMAEQAKKLTGVAEKISKNWARKVDARQKRRFYKSIKQQIGVDLTKIIDESDLEKVVDDQVKENVALIHSLPVQYYERIEKIVKKLIRIREPAKSIIDQLHLVGIITENRAKLIARDQTQKLNSGITKARQEALGVEEYEWQTSNDGPRVRKTHQKNNGKIFRWDTPPKITGHPGEDVQCRCVALPVLNLKKLLGNQA